MVKSLLKNIQSLLPYPSWAYTQMSKTIGFFERLKDAWFMFWVVLDCVSWDYMGILKILDAWLSKMQISQENDTWHVGANKHVEEIKFCRALLKRLIADDYSACDAHYERWGKPSYRFEPTDKTEKYFTMIVDHPNATTQELKDLERKEFGMAVKLDHYLEEQDYDYLFKTLKKRMRGWWT